MDLGLFNVSDTYQYVLNQSGANAITLGNGNAVNWNVGGVVALTGNQGILGAKTFYSLITQSNSNGRTATPELLLQNGSYYNQFISRSSAGAYNSLVGADDHSFIYSNGGMDDASLVIGPWSSGAKGLRITSAGDVGIGTASPTQTLHVTGSIYANSFTGNSFTGNSFIGNSFTLQNTGIKLLSPVSLTTANIWYDVTGLSGALSSGTWLVNAMALYSGSVTASNAAFRVLNSTSGTVYASAMNFHTASINDLSTTNISTIINLTSTTTVKLQALSSSTSANIIASGTGLANSGSCSQISFVKIS
jgi:hypothetical protein